MNNTQKIQSQIAAIEFFAAGGTRGDDGWVEAKKRLNELKDQLKDDLEKSPTTHLSIGDLESFVENHNIDPESPLGKWLLSIDKETLDGLANDMVNNDAFMEQWHESLWWSLDKFWQEVSGKSLLSSIPANQEEFEDDDDNETADES